MDLFEKYKDEPFFELNIDLSNQSHLVVKWNIFKDKKNNFVPVIRTRYILFDKDNNRQSLKSLNLTQEVKFKELVLSEDDIELLEVIDAYDKESVLTFIFRNFSSWINTEFKEMIESGGVKITAIN